ncbi:MAG: hypothetical protein JSU92_08645 [Deltaproteobacteria bacterium]|nr:MAG: hypothetical protein JSU92_08645 [Deltaproteobacteria bacterium]
MRRNILIFLVSLGLVGLAVAPAMAQKLSGQSTTILRAFEQTIYDEEGTFVPLYEYFTVNVTDAGLNGLSFHTSGWGRVNLYDFPEDDLDKENLTYGYLDLWRLGNTVNLRAGRQFIYMGVVSGHADGVLVQLREKHFGIGVFGGIPVSEETKLSESMFLEDESGDRLQGGRLYLSCPKIGEVGLSVGYSEEDNNTDQRNLGVDWALTRYSLMSVIGHLNYDLITEEIYDLAILPVLRLGGGLKFTYNYNRTIPTAALSKNSIFSVFASPDDKVTDMGYTLDMRIGMIKFTFDRHSYNYEEGDDTSKWGIGLAVSFGEDRRNVGAFGYHKCNGVENEYSEYRVYARYHVIEDLFVDVDYLGYSYDEDINGEGSSLNLVGDVGYELADNVEVLGAVEYSDNPLAEDSEVRGLVKVAWNFRESFSFDK